MRQTSAYTMGAELGGAQGPPTVRGGPLHGGSASHGQLPNSNEEAFEAAFNGQLSIGASGESSGSTLEMTSAIGEVAWEDRSYHTSGDTVDRRPGLPMMPGYGTSGVPVQVAQGTGHAAAPPPQPNDTQPRVPVPNYNPDAGAGWDDDPLADAQYVKIVDPFADQSRPLTDRFGLPLGALVIIGLGVFVALFFVVLVFWPSGAPVKKGPGTQKTAKKGLSKEKAAEFLKRSDGLLSLQKWSQAKAFLKEVSKHARDEEQRKEASDRLKRIEREETALGNLNSAKDAFEQKEFQKSALLLQKLDAGTIAAKKALDLRIQLRKQYLLPMLKRAGRLRKRRRYEPALRLYLLTAMADPQLSAARVGYSRVVKPVRKLRYRKKKRCLKRCRRRYRGRRKRKSRARCYSSCKKRYALPPRSLPTPRLKEISSPKSAPRVAAKKAPESVRAPAPRRFSKAVCYRSCRRLRGRSNRRRCVRACKGLYVYSRCCKRCFRRKGRKRRVCLYRCKKRCRRSCYRAYGSSRRNRKRRNACRARCTPN